MTGVGRTVSYSLPLLAFIVGWLACAFVVSFRPQLYDLASNAERLPRGASDATTTKPSSSLLDSSRTGTRRRLTEEVAAAFPGAKKRGELTMQDYKLLYHSGTLSRMVVCEHAKLLLCWVPKNGCTGWKQLFAKLDERPVLGQNDIHRSTKNYSLAFMSPEQALSLLNSREYIAFTVVRNPWHRVLSAFLDKLYYKYERLIPMPHKVVFVTENGRRHTNVTFNHFLSALKSERHSPSRWNEHWRPQTRICGFEHIQYDHVGRLDDIAATEQYLEPRLHGHRLPERAVSSPHATNAHDQLGRFYDEALVNLVLQLYPDDIRKLGFLHESPRVCGNQSCINT